MPEQQGTRVGNTIGSIFVFASILWMGHGFATRQPSFNRVSHLAPGIGRHIKDGELVDGRKYLYDEIDNGDGIFSCKEINEGYGIAEVLQETRVPNYVRAGEKIENDLKAIVSQQRWKTEMLAKK